jgi:hypothetical protein
MIGCEKPQGLKVIYKKKKKKKCVERNKFKPESPQDFQAN